MCKSFAVAKSTAPLMSATSALIFRRGCGTSLGQARAQGTSSRSGPNAHAVCEACAAVSFACDVAGRCAGLLEVRG
eukprot:8066512-Pyramimonas_sp.AAC.1